MPWVPTPLHYGAPPVHHSMPYTASPTYPSSTVYYIPSEHAAYTNWTMVGTPTMLGIPTIPTHQPYLLPSGMGGVYGSPWGIPMPPLTPFTPWQPEGATPPPIMAHNTNDVDAGGESNVVTVDVHADNTANPTKGVCAGLKFAEVGNAGGCT